VLRAAVGALRNLAFDTEQEVLLQLAQEGAVGAAVAVLLAAPDGAGAGAGAVEQAVPAAEAHVLVQVGANPTIGKPSCTLADAFAFMAASNCTITRTAQRMAALTAL
jgi:hypothetical protein